MGRHLTNKSNFYDDRSGRILMAAASRMQTPQFSVSELISAVWFKVVRYGGPHKYMYLHCCREMQIYIMNEKTKNVRQQGFCREEPVGLGELGWVDLLDGLTDKEKNMIRLRYREKNTTKAIGEIIDITRQAVEARLNKIHDKLKRQRSKENEVIENIDHRVKLAKK